MVKLGLTDTNDDNIIEIETKSGKRTVVNVLQLRDVDELRENIIRIGGATTMVNLDLKPKESETVIVRKAIKPVSASKITVVSCDPRRLPIGGYYLRRKFQGTPIYIGDQFLGTTAPNIDDGWLLFFIDSVEFKEEYNSSYGGMVIVTQETSFEEIIPDKEFFNNEKGLHDILEERGDKNE